MWTLDVIKAEMKAQRLADSYGPNGWRTVKGIFCRCFDDDDNVDDDDDNYNDDYSYDSFNFQVRISRFCIRLYLKNI